MTLWPVPLIVFIGLWTSLVLWPVPPRDPRDRYGFVLLVVGMARIIVGLVGTIVILLITLGVKSWVL